MLTLGIIGYSGVGKTTLLCSLIPHLRAGGLRVAAIKASHHDVRWDQPGKDSWRLQEAGAEPVLLAGPQRWYLNRAAAPGDWEAMLASLQPRPDLVLSEGNQDWPIPRLLVHRAALGRELRWNPGDQVLAVASDTPLQLDVPCLDLNDPSAIAQFILHWYGE
ncbi:molybdopterin-guanine dinucleotide biosynthesis protein B [Igneacidithiobacillus siniensis]|uniref:molybdopterin-guanine dinucleotide biosynthesis protein B n=1 Tax=Acidithiobacillus TaxID=119977 RepID=UPI0031FEECA1